MTAKTKGPCRSRALLEQLLRLGELPEQTQIRVPGSTPRVEASFLEGKTSGVAYEDYKKILTPVKPWPVR